MSRLLRSTPLLLLSCMLPAHAATPSGATQDASAETASAKITAENSTQINELSDEFLGDVSDGSKPAADGTPTEEKSGDTMDATLRTHTRNIP